MLSGRKRVRGALASSRPRDRTLEAGAQQRVDREVRVGVRRDRAHLDARRALVAERDADHRAAVDRRGLDLVGRLVVRVEPAVGVDARVEHQAESLALVRMRSMKLQPSFESPSSPLASWNRFLPLRERHVGVHAVAVDAGDRLGQEATRSGPSARRPAGTAACRAAPGRRRSWPRCSRSSSRTATAPPRGGPSRSAKPSARCTSAACVDEAAQRRRAASGSSRRSRRTRRRRSRGSAARRRAPEEEALDLVRGVDHRAVLLRRACRRRRFSRARMSAR
jgi:hypothetical protein